MSYIMPDTVYGAPTQVGASPARMGWQCPCCRVVYSPDTSSCRCSAAASAPYQYPKFGMSMGGGLAAAGSPCAGLSTQEATAMPGDRLQGGPVVPRRAWEDKTMELD